VVYSQYNTDWWKTETDQFIIYFPSKLEWEANQLLTSLENYKFSVEYSIGESPQKTVFILQDGGLKSSAWFNSSESVINQYISPFPSDYFGNFTSNHLRATGLHEFIHATHINTSSGIAEKTVKVFGPFLQPHNYSPDWIIEGIAISGEGELFKNSSMLNSGWSEAMLAAQVRYNILPYINELTHSPLSYYSHNDEYYIGGSFLEDLTNSNGLEKKKKYISEFGSYWWSPIFGNIIPKLGVDRAMKAVYGQSLEKLYEDWYRKVNEKYSDFIQVGNQITFDGWYKKYLTVWDDKIYFFKMFYSTKDIPYYRLIEFDPISKTEKVLCELKQWINAPIQIQNGKIYFSMYELNKGYDNSTNNTFGYESVLYSLDIDSGERRELITTNFCSFSVLPNDHIIYSSDLRNKFGSDLWKLVENKISFVGRINIQVSEMVSHGYKIFLSGKYLNKHFNIFELNLNNTSVRQVTNNDWTEAELRVNNDTMLLYTANYNKSIGLYGYDIDGETFYQLSLNGFSRRGAVIDSTLYFITLTERGEDIYKEDFNPKINTISENSLEDESADEISFTKDKVDNSIYSKLFVPYLRTPYFNQTTGKPGILFKGSDILTHFRYSSFLNYSSLNKSLSMTSGFGIYKWSPLVIQGYTDYENILSLSGSYPLSVTSKSGEPSVSINGNAYLGGSNFSDQTITPSISIFYDYPLKSNLIIIGTPLLHLNDKEETNIGLYLRLVTNQKNMIGYFRLDTQFQWQTNNKINFVTRGSGAISSHYGFSISPSFTFQILKLRKGLWDINFFFEDINGRVYIDYLTGDHGKYLSAIGTEAFLETSLAMGYLKFSPSAGIVYSQNDKWNYYLRLNFPLVR